MKPAGISGIKKGEYLKDRTLRDLYRGKKQI
jgi:hypothetical protein